MDLVKKQYNQFPYPRYNLLAKPRSETLCHLKYSTARELSGLPDLNENKIKILLLGCGTFEPTVFATAHPEAEILAVDLSEKSISRAKKHCFINGVKNVQFAVQPLESVQGKFDYVNCYGVLHHLEDPIKGFQKIEQLLKPQGLARIMVYSRLSRRKIFSLAQIAEMFGMKEEKNGKDLNQLVKTLPKDHPLRCTFALYRDAQNPEGLVDGFLHSRETGFSAQELLQVLQRSKLEVTYWQSPKGPYSWNEISYLEATDQLAGNFVFFVKKGDV